jgi:hypothetical protein
MMADFQFDNDSCPAGLSQQSAVVPGAFSEVFYAFVVRSVGPFIGNLLFPLRLVSVALPMLWVMAGCSHHQTGPVQYLYAAIPETALITVYPLSVAGTAEPVATIRERPPDKPVDVSVDAAGEVFVANENGNVRAYGGPNFHYELIHTIEGPHTRIEHPTAIVTNIDGTFYVADAGGANDKPHVEWFSGGQNGNVFPNRVISGPHTGITTPRGLALDGSGRLFVTDQATNQVLVFGPDDAGDVPPVVVLKGLHSPEHVFVDQLLNIYVSNGSDDSVSVFIMTGPQSWSYNATIKDGRMRQPVGIAADQNGRLCVAATGAILFFAPDSNNEFVPAGELRGRFPMNPAGIFIR